MDKAGLFLDAKAFLMALAYSQPRILAMFIAIPLFNRQLLPGMLRMAIAAGLGLMVAPMLLPSVVAVELTPMQVLLLVTKEAFVGFVLGFLVAIPFWAFEAVGFLIDNQRGASIAASLNPLTGNDSSPLGILFNQAFNVFFFLSGGFLLMLELLYGSFRLWDVFAWNPTLRAESMPLLIDQLMNLVRVAMLLASPVIVAMFLAELGLALMSRFVPQLQVFFLAMPIKSGLAFLVLMIYMSTLFDYALEHVRKVGDIVPMLDVQWRAPAGGAR